MNWEAEPVLDSKLTFFLYWFSCLHVSLSLSFFSHPFRATGIFIWVTHTLYQSFFCTVPVSSRTTLFSSEGWRDKNQNHQHQDFVPLLSTWTKLETPSASLLLLMLCWSLTLLPLVATREVRERKKLVLFVYLVYPCTDLITWTRVSSCSNRILITRMES